MNFYYKVNFLKYTINGILCMITDSRLNLCI